MANISAIKLPNGTTYTIKDNTQTRSDHRHYRSDLVPLQSKTYASTTYYNSGSGNWDNSSWYFFSVKPATWYETWKIKFKVHSYAPSYTNVDSTTWVTITGRADSITYSNYTERYDSAHYYIPCYPLKKAGFDAGYGHAIGISVLYAYNYTNSAYYRTFEVDLLEYENCTVTFLDTPVKWANWTGTGTTYYANINGLDAVTRGYTQSGDRNDTTTVASYYDRITAGANGLKQYSLAMRDSTGAWQSFTTDNGTGTAKTRNTTGFILGDLIYLGTGSNYEANTIVGWGSVKHYQSLIDYRYSFNCGTTLTADTMVYIVGTIGTDGLFYLDSNWYTQTLPTTEDNKIYIPLGIPYPDSGPYRGDFSGWHTPLWFKNGKITSYDGNAATVNGHTVNSDVPANAKFTDTVPTATKSATTGISIANHSTTSIYPVSSSTTSVYGVSTSTTTASKVTLGTAKSVPNVTSAGSASNWVFEDVTVPIRADSATSIPNVTSAGTAASWTFGDVTVPIRADADTTVPTAASSATTVPKAATSATTVPIKNANATTVPTAASSATACDDITSWAAGSGSASLTFTMDTTDTKKLKIAFSHSHTAPTLEYTARSITGVSGSTSIYGVQSTTTNVTGVSGSTTVTGVSGSTTVRGVKTGTSSTTTASHVTGGGNGTAPTLGTAISIYGVKSGTGSTTTASHVKSGGNGTAPTLGTAISIPNVTGVTDVTVPIKNADATVVPIKSTAVTVATSATHNVTDSGHIHTI